jgi:3-hydroxyacyl-[acyl-carrier-protein] dehydratase
MSTPKPPAGEYRLGIDQIQRFLPHRPPFLLIDRILEIHPVGDLDDFDASKAGVKVVAIKNVSFNEPHFQGHFPGFAIMPGVLIVEAMAQAASFAVYPYLSKDLDRLARAFQCILVGVNDARFRRPVVPGDTLRIDVEVTKNRGKLWMFHCVASVDGDKAADANLLANLIPSSEAHGK